MSTVEGKSLLIGAGSVGSKHLAGLLNAGLEVDVLDPNRNPDEILAALRSLGVPQTRRLRFVSEPNSAYDFAVLAQYAPQRLATLESLLRVSRVQRILLEKPVTVSLSHLQEMEALVRGSGCVAHVNLVRRHWPQYQELRSRAHGEPTVAMSIVGGAVGIGCNAVHFIDTFLWLTNFAPARVLWASIEDERVASSRGSRTIDFGGHFALESQHGLLFASLSATSSSGVVSTVRGAHWQSVIDYTNRRWTVMARDPASTVPRHHYGKGFEVEIDKAIVNPSVEQLTEAWVRDPESMPTLEEAKASHELMLEVLAIAGVPEPYSFT